MKTVHSAPNITLLSIFQSILEDSGIRCCLKNQYLSAGLGDLPPIECWPQLCVDEADYEQAQRLVTQALAQQEELAFWQCAACGEEIEDQFTECWQCGNSRILPDGVTHG